MKKLLVAFLLAGTAFAQSSNTKSFDGACSAVWPSAVRTMIENDFRPTVMEKDSGIATFSFEKTLSGNEAERFVLIPKFMRGLEPQLVRGHPMRLSSASLLLIDKDAKCSVTIKTSGYALFVSRGAGWEPLESNFAFEGRLLDAIAVTP